MNPYSSLGMIRIMNTEIRKEISFVKNEENTILPPFRSKKDFMYGLFFKLRVYNVLINL